MFVIQGKRYSMRSFLKTNIFITFLVPVDKFQLIRHTPELFTIKNAVKICMFVLCSLCCHVSFLTAWGRVLFEKLIIAR
jgi:hypothetical protein